MIPSNFCVELFAFLVARFLVARFLVARFLVAIFSPFMTATRAASTSVALVTSRNQTRCREDTQTKCTGQ
jgi:hypothetical protein